MVTKLKGFVLPQIGSRSNFFAHYCFSFDKGCTNFSNLFFFFYLKKYRVWKIVFCIVWYIVQDEDRERRQRGCLKRRVRLKRGFHFLLKKALDFVVIVYNQCLKSFSKKNRGISTIGSFFLHSLLDEEKTEETRVIFQTTLSNQRVSKQGFFHFLFQCLFQIDDVKTRSKQQIGKINIVVLD